MRRDAERELEREARAGMLRVTIRPGFIRRALDWMRGRRAYRPRHFAAPDAERRR